MQGRKTHGLENAPEGLISNSILQWNINRVALSLSSAPILLRPCSRKVFSEFMEAARHDAIGSVERFFDAVPVVAVDVDV